MARPQNNERSRKTKVQDTTTKDLQIPRNSEGQPCDTETKKLKREGGTPPEKPPKPPLKVESDGFRLVSQLIKTKNPKTIVRMGSAADILKMSPLALACSVGHRDGVLCLLCASAPINRQSPDGNYPLIQAVRGRFLDIIEMLLKRRATVSLVNHDGDNAFMIAVLTGDARMVNLVWPYRGDLDLNHANKDGNTALHLATERKWDGCAEFLLLNGADSNIRNSRGWTPLFISAVAGDRNTTEKLVTHGADMLIEDSERLTAMCRSIHDEKSEVVTYLIEKMTNAQKENFVKTKLDIMRTCNDLNTHCSTDHDPLMKVMFTVFKADEFKDTLYRLKAINHVLQVARKYMENTDTTSVLFVLCTMLMTDFGTLIDERFTLQFIRAQGQDIVLKTLKMNPNVEQLGKSPGDGSPDLVAGLLMPIVAISSMGEGQEWLKKNLDNTHLIRLTDFLRTGATIEMYFNCVKCPPKFKKIWLRYLDFFDKTMADFRILNEADLLKDEERVKQKAEKKKERKRLRRQKQREAKEENVNRNANGKKSDDTNGNKIVGAEKFHLPTPEDNVRYDQHVLMPDWNICIENVRNNDMNIIQTKHDPMQFRYNYLEPSIMRRKNGYHMPQAAALPARGVYGGLGNSEWRTVEGRRPTGFKTTNTKHMPTNQNANGQKKQKNKVFKSQRPPAAPVMRPPARVVGNICWADVAKGTASLQRQGSQDYRQANYQLDRPGEPSFMRPQHWQRPPPPLPPQHLQTQPPQMAQPQKPQQQQHHNLQQPSTLPPKWNRPPPSEFQQQHEEDMFTQEDFPTLRDDVCKVSMGETDVSDVPSTSTLSFYGEEQIDHIPEPVTDSNITGQVLGSNIYSSGPCELLQMHQEPSFNPQLPEDNIHMKMEQLHLKELPEGHYDPNPFQDQSQQEPHLHQHLEADHVSHEQQPKVQHQQEFARYEHVQHQNLHPQEHQQQQQQQQQQRFEHQVHMQPNGPPLEQFIARFPLMGPVPFPNPSWICRYGLNPPNVPPGFQARIIQPAMRPRMHQFPSQYALRLSYPQSPGFPAPQMPMDNITQSLLDSGVPLPPRPPPQAQIGVYPDHESSHTNERPAETDAPDSQSAGNSRQEQQCTVLISDERSNAKDVQNGVWNKQSPQAAYEERIRSDKEWLEESPEQASSIIDDKKLISGSMISEQGSFSVTEHQTEACTDLAQPCPREMEHPTEACTGLAQPCPREMEHPTEACTGLAQPCPREMEHPTEACTDLAQPCPREMNEEDFSQILSSLARCLAVSKSESVLFPDTLSENGNTPPNSTIPQNQETFPGFHESESSLFGNKTLNPFLLENIAKEQVKKQYRRIAGQPILANSAYFHDFDYYASLYGLTTDELKAGAARYGMGQTSESNAGQGDGITGGEVVAAARNRDDIQDRLQISLENNVSSEVQWVPQSRRWRAKLSEIIDLPYNMKKQMGRIVIPLNTNEYKINKNGNPIVLGLLTDGSEVAVRDLEAEQEVIDKDLVKKLASPDTNYNFLLRYKGLVEMGSKHYLATELCDYTLEEYISITHLDHQHDPLAANRLAWQLLKGIRYLHDDIEIVHGNLRPDNIYVDSEGKLRVGGYGILNEDKYGQFCRRHTGSACWQATETFAEDENSSPSKRSDVQVVGMLIYYILTGGRHPYGTNSYEIELNLCQNTTELIFVSEEVNDLISSMLFSEVTARPSIDACLRHPFFWSEEKRFRLVLIVGSDILKEMKTGVALTGSGSTTMTDFLNVTEHNAISDGWMSLIDGAVLKEMRAFRQYKNTLAEMVLFIYNCCLHFDKMSFTAREVLDDPCRYFLARFPPLFMAVFNAIKESDRTDRTCYKPFF